ncbi:MAG: isopenicillin N synthase family oxygenase [Chitinophagales bacterium]|jgi:isopenicillin N synthase-like dioxygenase|nr:isopenicillin N synthase family oxygenase [Chitinophagales bacterium]
MSFNYIPSVDLQDFLSDDKSKREKFVREIGSAYHEIGFVALRGHFLSKALQENLYKVVSDFFALPTEIKIKYENQAQGGQRGYTSFGREHAKDKSEGDLKEFWHFGQFIQDPNKLKELGYPENVHVAEIPEFHIYGQQAYEALEKTGIYVLRALALYLNLEEKYFDDKVIMGNSILRAIHYPPIKEEPKGAVRAGAHGDINLITLLMGASAKGLQVLRNDGVWVDAIASEDELMINVGDMLSRLTNNKLKSTIHQVINPPKELWHTPRYSIPFFMHPLSSMDLTCLPNCVDSQNPKQFEDINAGDFLEQRLKEIGLKS